jgi:hypothetical protein
MTVKELIEKLQEFDGELPIYYWDGCSVKSLTKSNDEGGDFIVFELGDDD